MEDQFGGRTDDDLFFDDFEPVGAETVQTEVANPANDAVATPAEQIETPASKETRASHTTKPNTPSTPRGGLANSRFNKPETRQRPQTTAVSSQAPKGPSAVPREKTAAVPGQNTALNAESRIGSGANPRTKLTEDELAAKMERMRILNAEKARKFEQAEKDERNHAESYARGMQEARKRKQAEEERRKRGEEERKRMDDERERNRERKLKAMGMKEGGWDEGKEAMAEEEARRGFRGANGGIRGSRTMGGLSSSRYAREDADDSQERPGDERARRGRGRGRGGFGDRGDRGRGGRGGRGGFGGDRTTEDRTGVNGAETTSATPAPKNKPVLKTEDFPALPSAGNKEKTALPLLSPLAGGRWDEEMEASEAKTPLEKLITDKK